MVSLTVNTVRISRSELSIRGVVATHGQRMKKEVGVKIVLLAAKIESQQRLVSRDTDGRLSPDRPKGTSGGGRVCVQSPEHSPKGH